LALDSEFSIFRCECNSNAETCGWGLDRRGGAAPVWPTRRHSLPKKEIKQLGGRGQLKVPAALKKIETYIEIYERGIINYNKLID